MKKLLLFIATEKGYTALVQLLRCGKRNNIGCVITFKDSVVEKDWSNDIAAVCESNGIPFFLWKEVKSNLNDLIVKYGITGAVTISWRYLLPLSINDVLEERLIVFHDSLLPKYRGFAPTPTAIMCGETVIGVTALFATDTVDQGEIVLQRSVEITKNMYIQEIIEKQSQLCAEMLLTIIEKMEIGHLDSYEQNESDATYSIWRNVDDCHIDWSKSAEDIFNFVRAVGKPYPGAFTYMNDEKIIIVKTEVLPFDLNFVRRDFGKIWAIHENQPEIICGEGMLRILEAVDKKGNPIRFYKVRCRLT